MRMNGAFYGDPVEFGVLGPLLVRDGDTVFSVGGRKQRTLLALLIASAGKPVSTDALLMGVYGPDAEPRARRSLQTYVSMVRRELGDVVRREGDGYVLRAAEGSIDAARFESLFRQAQATVDEPSSRDLLVQALALWRGGAYADVETSERLLIESRRLDELRAEAHEARIELDLQAGRHRQLLAELEAAIGESPLREGLRRQQMLAMYRSGRQADALRAYRDAADYLREELGLDPSRELQQLEQRILQQDRDLEYRPRPKRRALPARYTMFVGRRDEMGEVARLLTEHRLVTVTGPGGIGKSSLAVEVARSLAASHALAYVPIERNRDTDVEQLLAESVGVWTSEGDDLVGRVAEALGEVPTILVFDGCEHVIESMPQLVSELLRRCPGVTVLVTSREGLFIAGEHLIHLGPLDQGEGSAANELFMNRADLRAEDLDQDALADITEIGRRVSGLPLALELAAARTRTRSVSDIVGELDEQMSLLAAQRRADPRHLSIAATLDWSYRSLPPALQRTFRHLGVFRSGVPPDGVGYVVEIDLPEQQLRELVSYSLLGPPDPDGRFGLLEPIRQYAEALLGEAGELDIALLRHARWTARFWRREYVEFEERGQSPRFYELLRAYGPEAARVASWALANDEATIALDIVATVGRKWSSYLDAALLQDTARRALEHPAAQSGEGVYLQALARTAWLHRITDPDYARELLRRLDAVTDEKHDLETLQAVYDARATLRQVLENRWLDDALMTEALELFDQFLGYVEALDRPRAAHLYGRIILLQEVGRLDEADEELGRLVAWGNEGAPSPRVGADFLMALRHLHRGSFQAAVDAMRREARDAVEANDLGSAMEAERELINILTRAKRAEEAVGSISRYNEYAALLGWPPSQEFNPDVVAPVMAGLGRWTEFEDLLGRWVDQSIPASQENQTWEAFLQGRYVVPSRLVHLLGPTAQWLMHEGRNSEAATLLAAAPMAFAATKFAMWGPIGDEALVAKLTEELAGAEVADVPATLDELFWYIARRVRPADVRGSGGDRGREAGGERQGGSRGTH